MGCTGTGDNGDHCCYIAGEVCEFLFINRGGVPRCTLIDEWGRLADNPKWVAAPVGQWFADNHPGFDCGDWPQRIPQVMRTAIGLCCWGVGYAKP